MAGFTLPVVNPDVPTPPVSGASAMPSMPSAGAPVAAGPPSAPTMPPTGPPSPIAPPAQAGGLQSALTQLLPLLVSGIAAKRGGPMAGNAVLNGYAQGLAQKHQAELEHQQMVSKLDATNLDAQQKAATLTQERQYKLSQFIENITKQADAIDDPETFASMVDLADKTAQQAFGAAPGLIKGTLVYTDQRRLDKAKKDAQTLVDGFVKLHGPEALDQAIAAGATIDGKRLADLVKLTQYDAVTLPDGSQFKAPTPEPKIDDEKSYVDAAVAEARRQSKAAGKPWTGSDAITAAGNATRKYAQLKHIDAPTLGGASGAAPTQDDMNGDTQDILEGRNTMYNIRQTMGRTNAAAAYMNKLRRMIRAIDPKFDFVASDAGGKSVSSSYVQRAQIAVNSVLPNIDKIIELSNQVPRIGWKGVAELMQRGGVQFGNRPVTNLRQAQKLIADEIGVALGAGNVSDMKLQLGFDVTDPSVQPEVFADNLNTVRDFILNRDKGLKSLRYHSGAVDAPAPDTPPPASGRIRIRLADGTTGTIPEGTPIPAGATVIK